jgi:transposase
MEIDNSLDARKISKESRSELRKRAVTAYLSMSNKNVTKIASIYGIRRETLHHWIKSYSSLGDKSFYSDKRGAKKWSNSILTLRESNFIKKTIINKTPEQLSLSSMLWTRRDVMDLIKIKYSKTISFSTVSLYLSKWEMTLQKPKLQSYKQSPKKIQDWIENEYPTIEDRAKKEKTSIHWGDETGVGSKDQIGKGYSPIGVTPILHTSGSRFGVNMVSSITNKGEARFMLFEGSMNAIRFIDFLRRLTKNQNKKIFLILDNSRVHHALLVQKWTNKHKEKIELFFLPPYCPEYNPDELLNNTLKNKLRNISKAQNVESLTNSVSTIMKSLQNTPKIIKSFFHAKTTKYAA